MSNEAVHIYQTLLDGLTRALLTRDLKTWTDGMALPHHLTTADGRLVHETVRDVQVGFTDYVTALARLGVNKMTRTCQDAQKTGPRSITGSHITSMVRANGEPLPEFIVQWTLRQDDAGFWRVSRADSAMSAEQWADVPYNDLSQFQREDTSGELQLRREIQRFFNRVDSALLNFDYQIWETAHQLPLVLERQNAHILIMTADELRADFEHYCRDFRDNNVTEIIRVVRTAEMIGDALLIATYRAHILGESGYVVPPWNSAVTMRLNDGQWTITKVMNALGHDSWTRPAAPEPGAGTDTDADIAKNTDNLLHLSAVKTDTKTPSGRH